MHKLFPKRGKSFADEKMTKKYNPLKFLKGVILLSFYTKMGVPLFDGLLNPLT